MEQFAHGGNVFAAARRLGVSVEDIIDLSSNTVPEAPPIVRRILAESAADITRLPDPDGAHERAAIGDAIGVPPERIVIAAGTTELIMCLCRANRGRTAAVLQPTYVDYERFALQEDMDIRFADTFNGLCGADISFVCNPNNPTGTLADREILAGIDAETLVVDESYLPFVREEAAYTLVRDCPDNAVVLRSFSKVFGVPGLRAGYAVCGSENAARRLANLVPPWSPSAPARSVMRVLAGLSSLGVAAEIERLRQKLVDGLSGIDWMSPLPSDANFVLIRCSGISSSKLYEAFLDHRILIRDCANFRGLDDSYIRVSVRNEAGVDAFLAAASVIDRSRP